MFPFCNEVFNLKDKMQAVITFAQIKISWKWLRHRLEAHATGKGSQELDPATLK